MSMILTSGVVGLVLGIYLIVHVATLSVSIGSMNFQKKAYDESCYYYGECVAFYIIIPAMTLSFSILGIILGISQIILFSKRIFTRYHLFYLNLVLTLLWIPVIAIGWAPITTYYDYSIEDYAVGVTGWFIAVNQDYQTYQDANSYSKAEYTQTDITQIDFNMGLLIMSCFTFGFLGLVTIYGLIACISGKSNPTWNAAPSTVQSQQQWPGQTSYEAKTPYNPSTGNHEINFGGQRPAAVYPGT